MKIFWSIIIIGIVLLLLSLSLFFHDLNTINQCQKYGYTDNLVTGERIECREYGE